MVSARPRFWTQTRAWVICPGCCAGSGAARIEVPATINTQATARATVVMRMSAPSHLPLERRRLAGDVERGIPLLDEEPPGKGALRQRRQDRRGLEVGHRSGVDAEAARV